MLNEFYCGSIFGWKDLIYIIAYQVFSAIASRNTAPTLLNDSSSRSHCIVTLILWKYEHSSKGVALSQFQFCDLAGSERLENAHSAGATYKKPNGEWNLDVIQGINQLFTNYTFLKSILYLLPIIN